jgi:hypothetical protein
MPALIRHPNLEDQDQIYEWLVELHAGRSDSDSHRINARLVLLLANHVGDPAVIREAMDAAAADARSDDALPVMGRGAAPP